jgi:hypothetical protein
MAKTTAERRALGGLNDPEFELRGAGRTTRQLELLPQGALFVWCNGALGYPRDLARKLNRTDIRIISPNGLFDPGLRGVEWSAIDLDHATRLTSRQWELYVRLAAWVRKSP